MKFSNNIIIDKKGEISQSIRDIISEWANSIPHHPFRDLGQKIGIESITLLHGHKISLVSQYFSENTYSRTTPFNGKREAVSRIPDYNHPELSEFRTSKEKFVLPNSEIVSTCSKCNGNGKIICSSCNGTKRLECRNCHGSGTTRCYSCNGSGKIVCSYCNGKGRRDCQTCYGSGKTTCNSCRGSGWDYYNNSRCWDCQGSGKGNCSSCNGRGDSFCYNCMGNGHQTCNSCYGRGENTCSSCSGSGEVTCISCSGNGYLVCSNCSGYGQLISYKETIREWNVLNNCEIHIPEEIVACFNLYEPFINEFNKDEHTISQSKFIIDAFRNEPPKLKGILSSLILKSETSNNIVSGIPHLLHQELQIRELPLFKIHYTYEHGELDNNKPFNILISKNNKRVYEEIGPINNFQENLHLKGKSFYKRRNFGKSMALLKQANEMNIYSTKNEISNLFEKASKKVAFSYFLGAIIFQLSIFYFISIWSFDGLRKIPFASSYINQIANNFPDSFNIIYSAIFSVVFIGVIGISPVKRLINKLAKSLNYAVSKEIKRIFLGVLTIFGNSFWNYCSMILLHLSGLLIIPSFIAYKLILMFKIWIN